MSRNDNDAPAPLKALMRHPDVRAVLRLDEEGTVKNRLGQARSMKLGAEDPTVVTPVDSSSEDAEESIYVCEHDGDFVVVVFGDEEIEFEEFKRDIDETLAQWE